MKLGSLFFSVLWIINVALGQGNFTDISAGQYQFLTESAHGVSIADFDNDGDDDIYVSTLKNGEANKLFRNNGNFSFTEIAALAGVNVTYPSRLSTWFDADNDGWLDLLVSTNVRTFFFINNRDGTFSEFQSGSLVSTSSPQALLVGDVNFDGWLDVYTNNFQKNNELFINYGNLQFRNRTLGSGAEVNTLGMGGLLIDMDNDSDLDIYLVADGNRPNLVLVNNGSGIFRNRADSLGLGTRSQGMGIDFADFWNSGNYDFYISNLFENLLMTTRFDPIYANRARQAGVDNIGMGWGVMCLDYDNDGWSDIYLVNDHSFTPQPNYLYRNNGNGTFSDVSTGTPAGIAAGGYGCAHGDFNNDGLLDFVVANHGAGGIKIIRNNNVGRNWAKINLVSKSTNKFAVGARVKAYMGGEVSMDDVTVASGYASQNTYTLHIGLGGKQNIDSMIVRWPSGELSSYYNIPSNGRYLIVEDEPIKEFTIESYRSALNEPSLLETYSEVPGDTVLIALNDDHSVARIWNENLLNAIRGDFARPTVHARNLFHLSLAMYDAWAAYDAVASPVMLGRSFRNFDCPFNGIAIPEEIEAARNEAISYAAYRLTIHRFQNSPGASNTLSQSYKLMQTLGYDPAFTSTDYSTGSAAALGNYIAAKVIEFGLQDGSNESNGYANQFYQPVNAPMRPELPGNPNCVDPNRWQQIQLVVSIDQNGQPVSSTPPFLSPEWGRVAPFALEPSDLSKRLRDGYEWWVYHDPGPPPLLDKVSGTGTSADFKWNFELVSIWASHLDPSDSVKIDISPAARGNISDDEYPVTMSEIQNFYRLEEGGDIGEGYSINPRTNQPYQPQIVPRGDYARVLAEFWADGPKSETPPGHWFSILNYVSDHPDFERKFQGQQTIEPLEWDVKSYLVLGGALHDVAITCWGIKGYYDFTRPAFAIRALSDFGQSSDPGLPRYHPAGIRLKEGFIESVKAGDPLAGANNEHVGKVKLYTWRGPQHIADPKTDMAGVGWVLAENWWPYQRPTFVTPPFAGYISGHSTYSSAGAEVLTRLTGDEYFPGGMGEFIAKKNEYLVFEEGPSVDVKLQWARYKDASDQSSLSRIWGGIHPPIDDIPGRHIGKEVGNDAFTKALFYFNGTITSREEPAEAEGPFVFPNPAAQSQNIKIRNLSGQPLQVQIVDTMGRRIFTCRTAGDQNDSIPVALEAGVYLVEMKSPSGRYSQKLVVR